MQGAPCRTLAPDEGRVLAPANSQQTVWRGRGCAERRPAARAGLVVAGTGRRGPARVRWQAGWERTAAGATCRARRWSGCTRAGPRAAPRWPRLPQQPPQAAPCPAPTAAAPSSPSYRSARRPAPAPPYPTAPRPAARTAARTAARAAAPRPPHARPGRAAQPCAAGPADAARPPYTVGVPCCDCGAPRLGGYAWPLRLPLTSRYHARQARARASSPGRPRRRSGSAPHRCPPGMSCSSACARTPAPRCPLASYSHAQCVLSSCQRAAGKRSSLTDVY